MINTDHMTRVSKWQSYKLQSFRVQEYVNTSPVSDTKIAIIIPDYATKVF